MPFEFSESGREGKKRRCKKKAEVCKMTPAFRGTNQIRTGVNGFADRYLTTRTWYPFAFAIAKLVFFPQFSKFIFTFLKKTSNVTQMIDHRATKIVPCWIFVKVHSSLQDTIEAIGAQSINSPLILINE